MISSGNLFADISASLAAERFDDLFAAPGVRIERIVSTGQATPAGTWLQQAATEWVVLLTGAAALRFEDESTSRELKPGDWLTIPANARHRVEWTDAGAPTVWLAVHIEIALPAPPLPA
jgi:cupin 2 domain-containing protein